MELKDLLQCESCQKNLEDFIELGGSEFNDRDKELLSKFALYMEMARLKEQQVKPITSLYTPRDTIDPSMLTITC